MTPDHRIEKEVIPTPMQLYIDKGTDEVDYRGSPRGVRFPDQKESYGIEIRRGVAEFHQKFPEKMDATVSLNKMCLNDIMLGVTTTEEAIDPGKMKIDGLADHVVRFFYLF
jgi:alkyl sulfatase BDS1-like metallo-beta-lactamase superfamily hydrolase